MVARNRLLNSETPAGDAAAAAKTDTAAAAAAVADVLRVPMLLLPRPDSAASGACSASRSPGVGAPHNCRDCIPEEAVPDAPTLTLEGREKSNLPAGDNPLDRGWSDTAALPRRPVGVAIVVARTALGVVGGYENLAACGPCCLTKVFRRRGLSRGVP
jgi:hypothetical protein